MTIGPVEGEKSCFSIVFLYNLAKWQPFFKIAAKRLTLELNTTRTIFEGPIVSYSKSSKK